MERRRGGVCTCFVLFATFLTLTAAQERGRERERGGNNPLTLLTQPERVYYVSRHVAANITCEALGASAITFTCAGSQVDPASQVTYETYDEARGQTLIRSSIQVTRSQITTYQRRLASSGDAREDFWCLCQAEDIRVGVTERSGRGIVRLAFLRKRFQKDPESLSVELGSQAGFRCDPPQGEPTPEVVWRKDGRRVDPEVDRNFVVGADHFLMLRAVRAEDAGDYECAAKNHAVRRISNSATLTIKESREVDRAREEVTTVPSVVEGDGVKPLFLEKPPSTIYLTDAEPFSFTCHIQGTLRMTVRCNGQRVVKQDDKLQVVENAEANSVRIVLSLTYADVENYVNTFSEDVYRRRRRRPTYQCECVAWYQRDKADRNWQFETSNVSDIYLAFLKEDFEEEPSDVSVQEGETASLACQPPEGIPRPWVHWVFEQQRLDPRRDARYKVEEDGSLVIQQAQASDQGRYYCVVENVAASHNSRVGYLTVTSFQATTEAFPVVIPDRPVFTQDLESENYINTQEELTLVCSVVGAKQLTYRCNDDRLSPDKQKVETRTSPDGKSQLLTARTNVTADDVFNSPAETYICQCIAWYLEGKDWKSNFSNTAVVRLPYIDSKFRYDPKGIVVSLGETAEFGCQPPDGQPTPKVTWMKDGEPIDLEQDSNFIVLEDSTLIVEYVRLEDAGEYNCIAENYAGEKPSLSALLEIDESSIVVTTTPPEEDSTTTTPPPTPSTTTMYTTTLHHHHPDDGQTTSTMMTSSTTTAAVMLEGNRPIFTVMPDQHVFIIRHQPVTLRCGAVQVTALRFYCNGERVLALDDGDDHMQSVDPTPGLTYLEKSIEVKRKALENYIGLELYVCECRAYYQPQEGKEDYVASQSVLEIAYLKKKFGETPTDKTVQEGERVELVCRPPQGVPEPKVEWLKGDFGLQESDKMRITREGSLLFEQIEVSDAGVYKCKAVNVANSRYSDTVTVRVNALGGPLPTPTDSDMAEASPASTSTMAAPDHSDKKMMSTTPEAEEDDDKDDDEDEDGEPESTPEGEQQPHPETTPESEMPVVVGEPVIGEEAEAESENQVEVMVPIVGVGGGEQEPLFMAEPDSLYYIIKSRPVVIFCQTRRAERITFDCNGENLSQSRVHYQNNVVEGQDDQLMASIEVSREEVENYQSQHDDHDQFYCKCHAHYTRHGKDQPQYLTSSEGYVEVAYLKKNFRRVPENVTVPPGNFVSLHCEAPEGNPTPETTWMKDEQEVHGDLNTPDNALVFQSISAANAGTYYCVASNLANVRSSRPAIIVVTGEGSMGVLETGDPNQEGGGPEPGAELDMDQHECVTIIKGCSAFMPQTQRDQATSCQTLSGYLSCLDDFLQRCRDLMPEESVKSAQMARDTAAKICGGEGVCPELQKCQMDYAKQLMPDHSDDTIHMHKLCAGTETFLRCADSSFVTCGMSSDDKDTTLSDVATWFQQYCARVTEERWMEQCAGMSQCEVPAQQSAVLQQMLEVSLWCQRIYEMMECTGRVVESCHLEAREDVEFLTNMASVTCPNIPQEHGGDSSEAEAEAEKGSDDDNGLEPGKSLGHDDDDDDDNGAWTVHASAMLTSLLSVLFALTACR